MAHEHFYMEDDADDGHILLDSPILYYSGFVCEDPHWSIAAHIHPFCEIIYICEGKGRFLIGGREYSAGKGDLIVYNKGILHEEYSDPKAPLKTYFCGIRNVLVAGLEPGHLLPSTATPVMPAGVYTKKLEHYISDLVQESSYKLRGYNTICSNILASILVLVVRMAEGAAENSGTQSGRQSLTRDVIKYLSVNYNRNITLADLSRRFYISKDYLSHIFKDEIGVSPISYLLKLKIDQVKCLLANTNKTVSEIALCVGYKDANYLSRLFKKATGMTPTAFRGSVKKNGQSRALNNV